MALIQLTEPHQRNRQRRFVVGIDLGTTNSLVAVVDDNEQTRILTTDSGRRLLPSVVYYSDDGSTLVGENALAQQQPDPQNTLTSIKRLMGRGLSDVKDRYHYHYSNTEGMVKIRTAGGDKSPVEVSAEILKTLRQIALSQTDKTTLDGAVITVPAYFDDAQRQATKDAARLADIPVLRLLNEPTAAAVAYGLDNAEEGIYVIYDLGGGTFDLSVLHLRRGIFEVLATGGDTALGGDDYDYAIAMLIKEKTNLPDNLTDTDRLHLIAAAKKAKESVSATVPTTTIDISLSAGLCKTTIDTDEITATTTALTGKTINLCQQVLRQARVDKIAIKGVVLVGGATRIPSVRQAVIDFFGQPPHDHINPDEVVAIGAAAQADILIGNYRRDDWLLLDVIPLSLGIETMGGLVEKIIHRNETTPIERQQEFTTHQDGQTAMQIHIVQGERETVDACRSLATFTFSPIPPMAAGMARISVSLQVDADGLLSVTAVEKSTKAKTSIAVKPSYGLSESDIAQMLKAAYTHAEDDLNKRNLLEAQQEGKEMLHLLEKALADTTTLMEDNEYSQIKSAMATLQAALETTDNQHIKSACQALENASSGFVTRRMNDNITMALAGKSVDTV